MSKRAEFSQLDEADSGSDDDGSVYDSEESDASQDSVERKEAAIKRKMNKLKAQKESVVDDADTLGRNAAIELAHQKKMIAFAPRWLISPFVPLIMSLANIVGGSIIMNVTNVSECTEPLNIYVGGLIFLSYMYVIVYGSVFIGFFNMKWENMNTYKILASIIAFLGFVWGILGTLLHGSAGACEKLTPDLYSFVGTQVTMFWVTLVVYILCFARAWYLQKYASQRAARAAQADRIRKLEEEDRLLKAKAREEEEAVRKAEAEREAEEEKRRLAIEEEEAKKRALAEKYGVSSDEDEDDVANPLPGTANGVSKHSGNNLAALSARSGQDGFAVDVSDSDEG